MDPAADEFVHTLSDVVLDSGKWPNIAAQWVTLADTPHASLMDSDLANGPAKLSRRFAAVAAEAIFGHNVLDALNEPIACATFDGHLHRANIAFEKSLSLGHVLSLKQGVLQIRYPELTQQSLI